MSCGFVSGKTSSLRGYGEWRWFLIRIRPADFSEPNTFFPSDSKLTTLKWTKVTPSPCIQTEENPPYKGGWLEIDPARRGGMNQNTPNLGLTLMWHHSSFFTHWIGLRSCPRMSTFDHGWYWIPRSGCRQGTEMREATPSRGIMLKLRGECRTKALRETGESDNLQV